MTKATKAQKAWIDGSILQPKPQPRRQSWWLDCPDRKTFSAAAKANQNGIKAGRFGSATLYEKDIR